MRRDSRPYRLKRLHLLFQRWYAERFLRPQFDHLGDAPLFMKPWYVEVFGGPVRLGDHAHVIAAPDKRVRLTVWSNFAGQGKITIGNCCLICPGVRISAAQEITIGDSCMLAQEAFVTDSDWHGIYDRSLSVGQSAAVHIAANVWIGDSAIICKGVMIGENSIIGAGSVVRKDIPANVIAGGNPAMVLKELDRERPMKTRAEWFAQPECLAAEFDVIDRHLLQGNTWGGWLRSLMRPGPKD